MRENAIYERLTMWMYAAQHLCAKSWRHCLRPRRAFFLMKVTIKRLVRQLFLPFFLFNLRVKRWCNGTWTRVNRYHLPDMIRWRYTGASVPTAVIAKSMSSDISQSQLSIATPKLSILIESRDSNVTFPNPQLHTKEWCKFLVVVVCR